MKKIFLSAALMLTTLVGFAQSVTILPTSTLGGTNSWILNSSTNRLVAQGASNGIEANNFRATGLSSYANPLIYASNSSTTLFRYGAVLGTNSITQETSTASTQAGSSIEWKYYTDGATTPLNTLFGYSNNNFGITGSLSTTGIATFNSNATIMGAGAVRGKLFIGTTTTPSAGLEIQSNSTLVASPDIYLKSPNNIIRYGNVSGNAGMMQSVVNSATPGSASMSFVHLDNATPPNQTVMMFIDGEGDLSVNGFTKLGGNFADVPAVKTKYFTGTMTTANGGWPASSYDIAHGLTFSKIISMSVLVTGASNITIGENSDLVGYQYLAFFDNNNIKLIRSGASATASASITPTATVNVTFKVLLTYIP
jgi:hypothetical protein